MSLRKRDNPQSRNLSSNLNYDKYVGHYVNYIKDGEIKRARLVSNKKFYVLVWREGIVDEESHPIHKSRVCSLEFDPDLPQDFDCHDEDPNL